MVIQQPSAVLLLFITDLESLHRSTQLMPYEWIKDAEFMSTHAHSQEKGLELVQLSY